MSKRRRLNTVSAGGETSVSVAGGPTSLCVNGDLEQPSLKHVACKHPITRLPFELVATSILCDHFSLEELTRLDCALTNHSLRSFMMQVYAHVVIYRPMILRFDASLRWMRSRGIRGRHFEFWHGIGKASLTSFFRSQCMVAGGASFESLNLTGYDYLNDTMLTKLAQGSPRLTYLNLAYCSDITDAGVAAVAMNCRQMQNLVLWGCYQLSNDALRILGAFCPRITSLNLRCCRKIDNEGLQIITAGFRTMYSLNFTYCRNISDAGVHALAVAYPMLKRVSFAYCVDVSDEAVRHLAQHCHHIESLDLTNCNISNEALHRIAHSPMARTLKELFISTCRNVTDAGISRIGDNCKQLAAFHVAGCDQITVVGLRALPPTCVVHNPA